jgi:hypothetical protein
MINLRNYNWHKINLIEPLPQVGSKVIDYSFNEKFNLDDCYKNTYIDFIVNANYDFLLGQGHYKLNKKGLFVYAAGRVKIDELITYIDNDSGHYPNKNINHCIEIFSAMNLLDKNLTVYEI